MRRALTFIFLLFLSLSFLYSEKEELLRLKVKRKVEEISQRLDGIMGLAVKDLERGETFFLNENEIFPQASSIKIAILLEAFKQVEEGKLNLDEFVELKDETKTGGSGILQYLGKPSLSISIKDLCTLMIVLSDNTATNILIDRIGMDSVNKRMESIGLKRTRLNRKMMDSRAVIEGKENLSTPMEMMSLLEKIWKGDLIKEPLKAEIIRTLSIPKDSYLKRGIKENVPLASKPGSLPGVRCESGIVILKERPYIICVMTTFLKNDEDGESVISEISKVFYEYFSKLESSNAFGRGIK